MNVVILGILTKLALLALGLLGLWLTVGKRLQTGGRRQILPAALLVLPDFSSPARVNTCRLTSLPSRAPPGIPMLPPDWRIRVKTSR